MSKLNIFDRSWNDMVFEGRNKKYGAYQLRTENPRTTMIAFFIGAALFIFAVALPKITSWMGSETAEKDSDVDKIIEVVDIMEPPKDIPLPPPPPVVEQKQAPKSLVEEVKFKPLEAAKKEEVPDDPPKTEQFKEADPSSRNADASPTGDINIGTAAGDLDKGVEADDNSIHSTVGLQVLPEYPGGINAFYQYVQKNMRLPEVDRDLNMNVYVTFVVEKDGSITDVNVPRDPGYGLKKEAERLIKANKAKWSPGVQNGKPVRVRYQLPIKVNIKS
ncbi:MAG: energy transducer TonB [Flavobacterium sp.]